MTPQDLPYKKRSVGEALRLQAGKDVEIRIEAGDFPLESSEILYKSEEQLRRFIESHSTRRTVVIFGYDK